MNGSEIIKNKNELESHIKNGILLQIEDVIATIAGGALYMYKGIVYGEYCEGHPIALLRKGLCGKRFLIEEDKKVFELPSLQSWIAKQKNVGEYEWKPFNGIMSDSYKRIIDCIQNGDNHEQGLLLEYLLEEERIIFCDAKYKNFGIPVTKWLDVFCHSEPFIPIKGDIRIIKGMKIDGFDIDRHDSHLPEYLCIYNGAILSHYITYHIQKIQNVSFLKL
jgi:hypothetical protein